MSYQPIGKKFKFQGVDYCLGVATDDDIWTLTLFYQMAGQWMGIGPYLHDGMTNEDIMSHGSVSAYIEAMLPRAAAMLQKHIALPDKPDHVNKPACVAYDLALDVEFNPDTMTFALNKAPPLSHAR